MFLKTGGLDHNRLFKRVKVSRKPAIHGRQLPHHHRFASILRSASPYPRDPPGASSKGSLLPPPLSASARGGGLGGLAMPASSGLRRSTSMTGLLFSSSPPAKAPSRSPR